MNDFCIKFLSSTQVCSLQQSMQRGMIITQQQTISFNALQSYNFRGLFPVTPPSLKAAQLGTQKENLFPQFQLDTFTNTSFRMLVSLQTTLLLYKSILSSVLQQWLHEY